MVSKYVASMSHFLFVFFHKAKLAVSGFLSSCCLRTFAAPLCQSMYLTTIT